MDWKSAGGRAHSAKRAHVHVGPSSRNTPSLALGEILEQALDDNQLLCKLLADKNGATPSLRQTRDDMLLRHEDLRQQASNLLSSFDEQLRNLTAQLDQALGEVDRVERLRLQDNQDAAAEMDGVLAAWNAEHTDLLQPTSAGKNWGAPSRSQNRTFEGLQKSRCWSGTLPPAQLRDITLDDDEVHWIASALRQKLETAKVETDTKWRVASEIDQDWCDAFLQRRAKSVETFLSDAYAQESTLLTRISKLDQELAEHIWAVLVTNRTLQGACTHLQASNRSLEETCAKMKTDAQTLDAEVNAFQVKIHALQQELDAAQKRTNDAEKKLTESESVRQAGMGPVHASMQKQSVTFHSEAVVQEEQPPSAQIRIRGLQQELEGANARCKMLEEKLEVLAKDAPSHVLMDNDEIETSSTELIADVSEIKSPQYGLDKSKTEPAGQVRSEFSIAEFGMGKKGKVTGDSFACLSMSTENVDQEIWRHADVVRLADIKEMLKAVEAREAKARVIELEMETTAGKLEAYARSRLQVENCAKWITSMANKMHRKRRKTGAIRAWWALSRRRAELLRCIKLAGYQLYRWRVSELRRRLSKWNMWTQKQDQRRQFMRQIMGIRGSEHRRKALARTLDCWHHECATKDASVTRLRLKHLGRFLQDEEKIRKLRTQSHTFRQWMFVLVNRHPSQSVAHLQLWQNHVRAVCETRMSMHRHRRSIQCAMEIWQRLTSSNLMVSRSLALFRFRWQQTPLWLVVSRWRYHSQYACYLGKMLNTRLCKFYWCLLRGTFEHWLAFRLHCCRQARQIARYRMRLWRRRLTAMRLHFVMWRDNLSIHPRHDAVKRPEIILSNDELPFDPFAEVLLSMRSPPPQVRGEGTTHLRQHPATLFQSSADSTPSRPLNPHRSIPHQGHPVGFRAPDLASQQEKDGGVMNRLGTNVEEIEEQALLLKRRMKDLHLISTQPRRRISPSRNGSDLGIPCLQPVFQPHPVSTTSPTKKRNAQLIDKIDRPFVPDDVIGRSESLQSKLEARREWEKYAERDAHDFAGGSKVQNSAVAFKQKVPGTIADKMLGNERIALDLDTGKILLLRPKRRAGGSAKEHEQISRGNASLNPNRANHPFLDISSSPETAQMSKEKTASPPEPFALGTKRQAANVQPESIAENRTRHIMPSDHHPYCTPLRSEQSALRILSAAEEALVKYEETTSAQELNESSWKSDCDNVDADDAGILHQHHVWKQQ